MGTRVRVTKGYEDLVRSLGLEDPRRARHFELGECVLDSGDSRVLRFRWPDDAGELYYFKVYRYSRPRRMFTFTYRPSRTRTEFEALEHLRRIGVPAIEPVAYGSHRIARVIRVCYLITRGIEDATNLTHYLPGFFERPRTAEWHNLRRCGLEDLADMVRRMHESGFSDHDLYFRNILTRDLGPGEERLPLWFLDHPKSRILPAWRRKERHRARIHDLATLTRRAPEFFSRAERIRFFLRAVGAARMGPQERVLLDEVNRARSEMLAKQKLTLEKRAGRQPRPRPGW